MTEQGSENRAAGHDPESHPQITQITPISSGPESVRSADEKSGPPDSEVDVRQSEIGDSAELPLPPTSLSEHVLQAVETLLFASDTPLTLSRLCELAGIEAPVAQLAIDELNRQYEASGRTFRIHKVALGFQLYTLPAFAETVKRLYRRQFVQRLSGPALEVLAITAYKQPVTRPEIEKFRGVDCSGPLVTLLERRLITTAGRAHRPGSPFLYRTTREFLRYFGLESLDSLPPLEELGAFLAGQMAAPDRTEAESLAMDYDVQVQAGATPVAKPDTADSDTGKPGDEGKGEEHQLP